MTFFKISKQVLQKNEERNSVEMDYKDIYGREQFDNKCNL